MKFGTFHLFQKPPGWSDQDVFDCEFEQIERAEALGFDGVWLAEHHFQWYGIATDLMVLAAWVAARTSRVRIGTAIAVLPFHNPIRLAEQAATIDLISGGRLDFGVGRGYQAAEYSGFGISMDESKARFAECMEIILKAWTEETFSYDGQFTKAEEVAVLPRPVQQPHPPVYIASWMTPETVRYAAEKGFPIMAPAGLASDQIKTNYQLYRDTLRSLGKSSAGLDLPALVHIYVDDNDERGWDIGVEHSMRYGASLVTLGTPVKKGGALSREFESYREFGESGRVVKENRQELMLFGNPDTVAKRIEWMRNELGVNYIMSWMNMGGLPQAKVLRSMQLFAEEVMPHFRTVGATANA